MSVDDARARAMDLLRECRAGRRPMTVTPSAALPTLRELVASYCQAKAVKSSSRVRYDSVIRIHFSEWAGRPAASLGTTEFGAHCLALAQSKGAAVVELIRGLVGALVRYLNAVYSMSVASPFDRLAAAGLLPNRAKPRARVLQLDSLGAWHAAVDLLPRGPRAYLLTALLTGLRKNEVRGLRGRAVDLQGGLLTVSETKNGRPHTLPISAELAALLEPLCASVEPDGEIFCGVSAGHVAAMAQRAGAPKFMLHDLRKLLATVGKQLGVDDSVLRRILNHAAPKGDVMHRHYVSMDAADVAEALTSIQSVLLGYRGRAAPVAASTGLEHPSCR